MQSKFVKEELQNQKLIQDVQTRWNSSYDMLVRLLEQTPAIRATLESPTLKNAETKIFLTKKTKNW